MDKNSYQGKTARVNRAGCMYRSVCIHIGEVLDRKQLLLIYLIFFFKELTKCAISRLVSASPLCFSQHNEFSWFYANMLNYTQVGWIKEYEL